MTSLSQKAGAITGMRVILLALLATSVSAGVIDSSDSGAGLFTNEGGHEEIQKSGYDLLKNERNAVDTKRLLEHLHHMEGEISDELSLSEEQSAELLNEMKDYVEIKKDHIEPLGDTIEEINHKCNVDTALFQGDMLLTRSVHLWVSFICCTAFRCLCFFFREQAEEVIDDIEKNEGNRNKRQAYRDRHYPKTLWSNGVYYSFYANSTEQARMVFKKAVAAWQSETCIDFSESNTGLIITETVKTLELRNSIMKKFQASDRIVLIKANGCWSMVGRVGGVQSLSLGSGCESVGTATHEIGHALGFFHTQSRHDRDSFITLHTQNFMVNLK
uniref:Metalloendopeptidase n=1 Tax=Angiostrongylus cantonensis TaxID=6313 RepID=A0A0K0D2L8_ANGCA